MKLSSRFSLFSLISISGFFLLAACGGGGGDNETSTKDIKITSENAEKVARLALEITGDGVSMSASTNGKNSALTNQRTEAPLILKYKQALNLISQSQKQSKTRERPQASTSYDKPCDSGMVKTTYNMADLSAYAPGDTIEYEYANCSLAAKGATWNGKVLMRVTQVSDQAKRYDIQYSNYSKDAEGSAQDEISNGELDVSLGETSETYKKLSTVHGGHLEQKTGSDILTLLNPNLTNFEDTTPDCTCIGDYTFGHATIGSQTLGGKVYVEIPEASQLAFKPNAFPTGRFKVTGEANSSMTVTLTGTDTVKLDIDSNGDGRIDTSRVVSWNTLKK
jgi:hypothetical protein